MDDESSSAFISRACGLQLTPTARERFNLLPDEMQNFYRKVHNGYEHFSFALRIREVESLLFLSIYSTKMSGLVLARSHFD